MLRPSGTTADDASLGRNPIRFSICMPVFNGEPFIARAISSILAQTEPAWELIIVDNASTDATWSLIQNAKSQDSRIRAFQNPQNLGLAANLAECLKHPRGEWIGFLPVDDIYRPSLLSQVDASDADVMLWFHAHESVHPDGRRDVVRAFPTRRRFSLKALAEIFYTRGNVFGELSCAFARSEPARRVADGFLENRSTVDVDFWLRLALANPTATAVFSPEVLSEATIHHASESSRYNREGQNWVDFFAFLDSHSHHPWPFAIRCRQALRASYCLARYHTKLPRGRFKLALQTVLKLLASPLLPPNANPPKTTRPS